MGRGALELNLEETEASAGAEQQFPMLITDIFLFDHSNLGSTNFSSPSLPSSGGMKKGARREREEISYGVLDLNSPW